MNPFDMSDPDIFYENAVKPAAERLRKLLSISILTRNQIVEDHCHAALKLVLGEEHDKSARNPGDMTKKIMSAKHTPQELNFHLRFQVPWNPDNSNSPTKREYGGYTQQDYEMVTSTAILDAPIADICIVSKSEHVPEGYYRINRTPSNKKANLNTGAGGDALFFCIKKLIDGGDATPVITALVLVYPDRGENIPPGYSVARRAGKPCNLNANNSCERVFLGFKRDPVNCPITDIAVFLRSVKDNDQIPPNFMHLERTMKNHEADLNVSTSGSFIGLCYKQELCTVQCLEGFKVSKSQLSRRTTMDMGLVYDEVVDARGSGSNRRLTSMSSFDAIDSNVSQDNGDYMNHRQRVSNGESIPSKIQRHSTDSLNDVNTEAGSTTDQGDNTSEISARRSSSDTEDTLFKNSPVPRNLKQLSINSKMSPQPLRKVVIVSAHGSPLPRNVALIMLAVLSGVFSVGIMFDESLDILSFMVENLNFFFEELRSVSASGTYTILDLMITALCEKLDWSVEVVNKKVLTLLHSLIKRSSGILSKSSSQQLFKGTMFVSSCYAMSTNWIQKGYCIPMEEENEDLFSYKVLKTLVKTICMRCEECTVDDSLPTSNDIVNDRNEIDLKEGQEEDDEEHSADNDNTELFTSCLKGYSNLDQLISLGEAYEIVVDLVTDVIDQTIDMIEVSKITEIAYLATSKKSSSTTSSSFWVHLNSISKTLFTDYGVQNAFILLAALCKYSWSGISTTNQNMSSPRHLGNKLLGLDGIFELCRVAGQNMLMSKIFGYQIRRLVVSVIFVNMQYAMADPRIFRKLLRLVTVLWENWREHIRLEFPVLCEQLIIKILQTSTLKIFPIYQYLALDEVVRWYEQPHMLVEMFVNFDMDTALVSDWNIFAHLIRVVCKLAEKADDNGASSQCSSGGPWPTPYSEVGYADTLFGTNAVPILSRDVKVKALHVAANMTRAVMDAAGHANLISQDIIRQNDNPWSGKGSDSEGDDDDCGNGVSPQIRMRKSQSLRRRIESYQKGADILKEGIAIYEKKNSIAKAIKYLVSKGFMSDSARDAASFLRLYRDNFAPSAIGDYLGEGGIPNSPEEEYWSMVRYQFSRAVSFVDMPLDVALRLYLTGCGFRMPGEAQKIERFVSTFTRCYWEDNRQSDCCPLSHEDTVLLVVYAIVMLNTDLHHANNDKKRAKDKMTEAQFKHNLRGCDQGEDVDSDYLSAIYNGIKEHPIDWVDSEIVFDTGDVNAVTDKEQNKKYVSSLLRNLRASEDLLRSFSPYYYRFGIMGVDLSISMELIAYMFESVWHYFRAVADILLEKLANEENVIFSALDVAVNSLTACIFIDLKVQKIAFVRQVMKFRDLLQTLDSKENSKSKIHVAGHSFTKSSIAWYDNVEKSTTISAIPIVAEVHGVVTELKDVVRKCARREATRLVFARIELKAGITDANRFIILEADLKKMNNKDGKFVQYRFFLFSDLLVYAHHGFTSYKVHHQLSLEDIAVNGIVAGDDTGCCFSVTHPVKSFIVSCSSITQKQQWYGAIKEASEAAISRKSGQRLAMLKRMQSQEMEVSERQHMHINRQNSSDGPQRRGSDPMIEAPEVVEVPKGLAERRTSMPSISAIALSNSEDAIDEEEEDDNDDDNDEDNFENTKVEQCADYITSLGKRDASRVFVSVSMKWHPRILPTMTIMLYHVNT